MPAFVSRNRLYQNILSIERQRSEVSEISLSQRWGKESPGVTKEDSAPKESCIRPSEFGGGATLIKPKNKRLTDKQRHQILTMRYIMKMSWIEISQALYLQYWTVTRIIIEYEKEPFKTRVWFKFQNAEILNWRRVEESLKEYVGSASNMFSSIDVQKYVKEVCDLNVSHRDVKNYMKDQLGFSYRKVSGRPIQAYQPKNRYLKTLFWLEFGNLWIED